MRSRDAEGERPPVATPGEDALRAAADTRPPIPEDEMRELAAEQAVNEACPAVGGPQTRGGRPVTSRGRAEARGETLSTVLTPDRKEVTMTTSQLPSTIPSPAEGQDLATVPMKFEVTPIPVSDFDRAKAFYQRLGWRLDIDLQFTEQVRSVQFTPPGSPASIQFGPAGADRLQHLLLIVDDIEAARGELVDRGIEVSEIFHALPGEAPQPGRDPDGRSYVSHAV